MKPSFKQTEVGVIPEDWELRPIMTVVRVASGQIDPRNEPYRSMILVAPDHIESRTGRLLQKQTAAEQRAISGKYTFDVGDIVYSKIRPYLRKAILANFAGLCSADMYPLKPAANVSSGFMLAVLLGHNFSMYAESVSIRSGMPKINREELAEYTVALPPNKTEQEAIASALGDADALIESLERLIAKKRDLKQGAMQELLSARRRLPGFTGEWEEKRLDSLFDFGKGVSAPRDKLSSTGHCYLHYGDIHTSTKTHVNVAAEQHELPRLNIPLQRVSPASLLEDGDVVFVDASEDDAGTSRHVVVFNPGRIPFISGLHTIVAKSKTDELDRSYRCYCFQTAEVQRQFIHYAVGTKVSGISKGNLGKITVRIPKPEEQTAIAAVLSDMDAEIAALEAKLAKARVIKQGMMQELLTGKIRLVSPASGETPMPAHETLPRGATQPHNWQFNEAVVIAILAKHFGSEQWPLGRKRYTKLAYLFHRHVEQRADGFLKKAAGPYNPAMKYKGPEGIALKNRYIRKHVRDQFEGFVADDRVAQAEEYFSKWYGNDVLGWLEQFRKKRNDELELIATVDMAMEELHRSELPAELATVKQMIHITPEWAAKLQREIFSDANITLAINTCIKLFA